MRVDVSAAGNSPGSSAGISAGIDPRAIRILAAPLITGALPLPIPAGEVLDSPLDRVSASLPALTDPVIRDLLQVVEDRLFPAGTPRPEESATVPPQHVAHGSYVHAAQNPGVAALFEARDTAIQAVANALRVIEVAEGHGHRAHGPGEPDPQTVLAVANQFIETGQMPNYLRAAELASLIAQSYAGPVQPFRLAARLSGGSIRTRGPRSRELIGKLWRRAPMLILLVVWMFSGLIAALLIKVLGIPDYESSVALDIWAMGFLVLIAFQFVVTIRGAFRSKRDAPGR